MKLAEATVILVANGAPDSAPVSGVQEHLVRARTRRIVTVHHPLSREDGGLHQVAVYERGELVSRRRRRIPVPPPAGFAFDPFVPLRLPRADLWIGFNNLATARGLSRRARGRARRVAHWAVDFVPERFGQGPLTRLYDALDAFCCRRVDLRVELSAAAAEGRNERLGLGPESAPTVIAPIGAWLDRLPVVPEDGWRTRRIVYLGGLVERQGVAELIRALPLVQDPSTTLDITGRGPLEPELRRLAADAGVGERVRFHGYLERHRDVESLAASAAVAAAPYDTRGDSFSRYADPSKLRTYTAAGLPIVLTDVPPNAHELVEQAGAEVVDYDAAAIAAGIDRILADAEEWRRRRAAALAYAQDYDWGTIVGRTLARIGFESA